MDRRGQFSLGYLFIELTLIAATIGAMRLVYVLRDSTDNWMLGLVQFPAFCAVPILAGTAVGGVFGRFGAGALWGAGALVTLLLLLHLLVHVE